MCDTSDGTRDSCIVLSDTPPGRNDVPETTSVVATVDQRQFLRRTLHESIKNAW
eukprot:m.36394 g.36394  ORF g.36394 m.36394 type:complete len:54 (-) comp14487_c0_seq1:944-1105(-)